MASVKEISESAKNGNGALSGGGDVEAQLERLRDDLAALASTVASNGASHASQYKARVREMAAGAVHASQDAVRHMGEELKGVERKMEQQVRERPVRALGIAAAVGFGLALIATRR
jgi:ElaB/YqjD/DUF883 family membrane-anchored ribosome-binding protein